MYVIIQTVVTAFAKTVGFIMIRITSLHGCFNYVTIIYVIITEQSSYIFTRFRRSEFDTTEIELVAIAADAKIGFKRI